MGHFIGFPLKVDPGSTRGGEFVWAGQPPQKLFDQLHHDAAHGGLALVPGQSIVDIAHPRQQVLGYFAQFFVDSTTAQPYTPTGILGVFAPYGDEFQPQNFSYDFDALEVITNNHYEDIHSYVAPNPLPPRHVQPGAGARVRSSSIPRAARCSPAWSRPGSRCSIVACGRPRSAPRTRTTCSATSRATHGRWSTSARARNDARLRQFGQRRHRQRLIKAHRTVATNAPIIKR